MAEASIRPDLPSEVTPTQSAEGNRNAKRSLAASTTGQLFEWYEWTAYAVFAPFIAAVT